MQNKGFVKVFAVLLTLVCVFYLSFSFVTRHYTNKAKEIANGLPLWGRGGIDKVPLCKVIMGDERQGSLTLPRLFMLPSIQSIPVYGFLFHPTKITSWGKNVQEYGVKTIKSVENKYL